MAITAASLMVKVGADVSQAQRGLAQVGRAIDDTARRATSFRSQWDSAMSGIGQGLLSGFAGGMGFGAITTGLNSLVGGVQGIVADAARAYIETERLTMSFKAMSAQELVNAGSAKTFTEGLAMAGERAQELLNWTQELAIASPYNRNDVAGLMRMGMVYGFNSEQAKRSTKAITDYGVAMGLTGPEMERVIRALGQMNQRGKVTSQELMQLSEVGVGGLKILADAAGVSTAEMQKLVESGLVPAGPALETIIGKLETYDGAAQANAGTLGGLLASLQDMKDMAEIDLFGPMFASVTPAVQQIVDTMKDPEFRAGMQAFGQNLGTIVASGIAGVASSLQTSADSVQKLMDAQAPPWLTTLGALPGATVEITPVLKEGLQPFDVPVQGKVMRVDIDPTVNYGVEVDATGKIVTIDTLDEKTGKGIMAVIDTEAKIVDIQNKDGHVLNVTASWQQGTIGSLIAAAQQPAETQKILLVAGWKPGAIKELTDTAAAISGYFAMFPIAINLAGSWMSDTVTNLWNGVQTTFKEPIMLNGSWLNETVTNLWNAIQGWFTANPVNLSVQTSYTPSTTPRGAEPGAQYPIDITPAPPEYNYDPRYGGGQPYTGYDTYRRAGGDDYYPGGWAIVGEKGPELVNLPKGMRIYKNSDTVRMLEAASKMGGLPQFAEGNAPPLPGGAFGPPMSPKTWLGLSATFGDAGELVKGSVQEAGKDFKKSVKEASADFRGMLGKVPGLFSPSQVTDRDMQMAKAGAYQEKADEWLRQLSDEVLNNVEHGPDVDIKDAARRAGIDPNMPNEIVLQLVKEAWANGSFFADPKNLELINMDAVKASVEQQEKEKKGNENLMALFGIGDEQLVQEIAGMGFKIQYGLSQYLSEQGMAPVGAQAAAGLGAGIAQNGPTLGTGVQTGFGNWLTSPDGVTATNTMGENLLAQVNAGWKDAAGRFDWSVPTGSTGGPPAPAGTGAPSGTNASGTQAFASGTLSSREGWALVGEQGPELVRLPGGARVYNASDTAGMAPQVSVVINASVNQPHDVELLARRVARVIQQKRA